MFGLNFSVPLVFIEDTLQVQERQDPTRYSPGEISGIFNNYSIKQTSTFLCNLVACFEELN